MSLDSWTPPAGFAGDPFVAPDPDEPGTYMYIPGPPLPETDPQGRPSAHLWLSGETGILQLGTRWGVPEARLERLRETLAKDDPQAAGQATRIRLVPAPVTIAEVALLAVEDPAAGRAQAVQIATSRSSGVPPYTAIFGAHLTAGQASTSAAALNGNRGRLFVVYRGAFQRGAAIHMALRGDLRKEATALGPGASVEDARRAIRDAQNAGHLAFEASVPAGAEPSLIHEHRNELEEIAARLLASMARGAAPGSGVAAERFAASFTRRVQQDTPFETRSDVADWFAGRAATDHIHPLG